MSGIFLSYRREDSGHITGRIYDRLVSDFGPENVFKDVDSIPVGVDFRTALRELLGRCDVVLIVIGTSWLETRHQETGLRRLDRDDDYVRFEIEIALGHNSRIVPVLVDHSRMPEADELPETIRALVYRNAAQVRPDPDFHRDMDRLIHELRKLHPAVSVASGRVLAASKPEAPPGPRDEASPYEALWRELGPAGAMGRLEATLRDDDEASLQALMRFLRRKRDPAVVPLLFHLLAHRDESIRKQAKRRVQAIGWPVVLAASREIAWRAGEDRGTERVGYLLEGLAAIEANSDVVSVLNELCDDLTGSTRNRAMLLRGRKQAGLRLEQIVTLFRDMKSSYRIERVLGQGLVTDVFLARHELTEHPVVVRMLRDEFVDLPRIRADFLDVSKRSFAYVHDGLVHTRDVLRVPKARAYYTVRDYVDGVTLQAVLSEGRRFEPPQVLEILRQILEALTPVHRAAAFHGGIKPTNVFLCHGEQERVRVILGDPGVPTIGAVDQDRLSYDYRYAPPELFQGGGKAGPQSDFYALGCLAYELLCGNPPFVSDNHYDLIGRHGHETIPPPSLRGCPLGRLGDPWVMRLLAKQPAGRFANLEEALEGLKLLVESLRTCAGGEVRPHTILGQESLARYQVVESIVDFTRTAPGQEGLGSVSEHPWTRDPALPAGGRSWSSLRPGQLFGRYEIVRMLGKGGMGAVYLAEDTHLARQVALKILRYAFDAAATARFAREGRAAAALRHENICPIYDFGEFEGIAYLTMPYLEGESLESVLRQGPVAEREAAGIARKLAGALAMAHERGIIHRDLKPSNIMMDPAIGPILMDFGVARVTRVAQEEEDAGATLLGQMVGTPAYMSPEQFVGDVAAVGPATDVYGLGAVLYELLSGQRPFRGAADILLKPPAPPSSLRPDLDRRLEAICLKAMAKRIEDRYPSMTALAEDLDRYLSGTPLRAADPPRKPRWWLPLRGLFGGRGGTTPGLL